MPGIDAAKLVTDKWCEPVPVSYNTRDAILYAIGIGSSDLRFVYEKDKKFAVFPTYPIVLGFKGDEQDVLSFPSKTMMKSAGLAVPPKGPVLDAERELEILKPLPRSGKFFLKSKPVGLHDKRRGALAESESVIVDANGEEYVRMIGGAFFVGVTGFKSAGKSYSVSIKPPSRQPDKIVEQATSPTQAQLYRLSGDYNPLHVDPVMAKSFRFPEPILHGLCTFGHAARHVLEAFGDNDASNFRKIRVRFSKPVLPGQTIQTKMWNEGNGRIVFICTIKETGDTVISNAYVELKNVSGGSGSGASPAAGAGASAGAGAFKSDVVFAEMRKRINKSHVENVGAVFKFQISNGAQNKTWVVDVKNGSGSVKETDGEADCTLIIEDEDLVALMTGKLNGMEAFMSGKLQIEGDMMLAQKLGDLSAQSARL